MVVFYGRKISFDVLIINLQEALKGLFIVINNNTIKLKNI